MIPRRTFIAGLGATAAWPLAARAQQPGVPVIGFLALGTVDQSADYVASYRKGLSEMGYAEGRNVAIEFRWAQNDFKRLPELATDLVRRRATVITTVGTAASRAAQASTSTIPIVFRTDYDPVEAGLVTSLSEPGGNLTGIAVMGGELDAKRLGLIHQLLPRAQRFGFLDNPGNTLGLSEIAALRAAASAIGVEIEVFEAGSAAEIDKAFATLVQKQTEALVIGGQFLFAARRAQIIGLAAHHSVPVVYSEKEYARAGGLMSYGPIESDPPRQAGIYTGRILKGEKPADLAVVRSTKFEFVINLQAAKLIGIDIPPSLLALADEVIE
jgi:putative ABC transport system substrate-binding protein